MGAQQLGKHFLDDTNGHFQAMKNLAGKAIEQLDDADLAWSPDCETNSVAVLIKHLHGNMLSRWTDFLTSDGEKPWRERDEEFIGPDTPDRSDLLKEWEDGWTCLFQALDSLGVDDLLATVKIRGEEQSVIDAIHRQISHYAYHTGQIVQLAKLRKGTAWKTLSIARGQSKSFKPST